MPKGYYTKKHTWHPCEYVYKGSREGKEPGEVCCILTRVCRDGKYLCWRHSPERVKHRDEFFKLREIKYLKYHEARINEIKRKYGIKDDAADDAISKVDQVPQTA